MMPKVCHDQCVRIPFLLIYDTYRRVNFCEDGQNDNEMGVPSCSYQYFIRYPIHFRQQGA